jgi:hypothetical protein
VKEIGIGPLAQLVLAGALLAAVIAAVALQWPEIQRYLKIRSM